VPLPLVEPVPETEPLENPVDVPVVVPWTVLVEPEADEDPLDVDASAIAPVATTLAAATEAMRTGPRRRARRRGVDGSKVTGTPRELVGVHDCGRVPGGHDVRS
jgi:hypothetical protein